VIASGHISDAEQAQIDELRAMSRTGVQALILITTGWRARTRTIVARAHPAADGGAAPGSALGLYECPYPYKRLVSTENLAWAAGTGRFCFMKDTCCDAALIRARTGVLAGSVMKLYNANSTTLLASLRDGAAGYSGVMANFHPALYHWLCGHTGHPDAARVSDFLSVVALIERQCYPVNAKYHVSALEGLNMTLHSRVRSEAEMTDTFRDEVAALDRMARRLGASLG
jgi:4-hydroxy-tetrahydrodipicolinate synthase